MVKLYHVTRFFLADLQNLYTWNLEIDKKYESSD